MKKRLSLLMVIVMILSMAACGTGKDGGIHGGANGNGGIFGNRGEESIFTEEMWQKPKEKPAAAYAFAAGDSEQVTVNDANIQKLCQLLDDTQVAYGYEELFDYDRSMAGFVQCSVGDHQYSALDAQGQLTAEHLSQVVIANNAAYLKENSHFYEAIPDGDVLSICRIITDTIQSLFEKYPQVDKARVYCNLGNLKILEKGGALDFAAVESGMLLHVNRNTAKSLMNLTNGTMYSVLAHEAVHIFQYGCTCEIRENCTRRCGLAYLYDNEEQDHSDWLWIEEASAERISSAYLNAEPMTYTAAVNYLLTLDMVTMLQEDAAANGMEQLSTQGDPEELMALFGAETAEEKKEIYRMIYALEIMQTEPMGVRDAYESLYGQAWSSEIRDDLSNKIKRPIVQTLTKCFFKNLAQTMQTTDISKNDVLFLLNLYESTVNSHLRLDKAGYDDYNRSFAVWYAQVQDAFFACMDNVSQSEYMDYAASDGKSEINAVMNWLTSEKKALLIEKFESNLCAYKFSAIQN